jgi:hypothetical protein
MAVGRRVAAPISPIGAAFSAAAIVAFIPVACCVAAIASVSYVPAIAPVSGVPAVSFPFCAPAIACVATIAWALLGIARVTLGAVITFPTAIVAVVAVAFISIVAIAIAIAIAARLGDGLRLFERQA